MLEFYQAYATYEDLMLLTEELICHVAREVLGTLRFACQGAEIDLTPPWRRLDLRESLTVDRRHPRRGGPGPGGPGGTWPGRKGSPCVPAKATAGP